MLRCTCTEISFYDLIHYKTYALSLAHPRMSGVLRGLARALQKPTVRYPLLVAWLGFLVATGISAPTFLDKTSQDFTPPADTLAVNLKERKIVPSKLIAAPLLHTLNLFSVLV